MDHKNYFVRNQILKCLESGEFSPENRLPGARDLTTRFGVSLLTVQNVLDTLVSEGLLNTIPRSGTFVNPFWKKRILQGNISFYIPFQKLPWFSFFADHVTQHFSDLHLTEKFPSGIFEIRPTWDAQIHQDSYLDAAPLLKNTGFRTEEFFQAPFHAFRQNNKLNGIPFLFSPRVMFVNTAMLKKSGLPCPSPNWTWDDFIRQIQSLLRIYKPEQIFHWSSAYFVWMNLILRAGGAVLDPSAADPVQLDSEKTRYGLTLYRNLRHLLHQEKTYQESSGFKFTENELVFMIDARQAVGKLKKAGMKDWTVLPLPRIPGGKETSMQATELLCIRKECISMKNAEALIRFLLSEPFQNHLAEIGYGIPVRKASAELTLRIPVPGNELFWKEAVSMHTQYHFDSSELAEIVIRTISRLLESEEDIHSVTRELAEMLRSFFKFQQKIKTENQK